VKALDAFLSSRLSRGRPSFTREDLLRALAASSSTLTHSLSQLARKGRIANPRPGFYLALAPEDKNNGAPDPTRWIGALMQHQQTDYRISLLSAAEFHGAINAAPAMQIIAPKPMKDFAIGRYRIEFQPMAPNAFARTNRAPWLTGIRTKAGEAKVAGIELALFDCAKWFHKAGGISQAAQVARQLGSRADPRRLASIARACDNADVMRLGYLLELAGHEEQARALDAFAQDARQKLLDPTSKIDTGELSGRWKITLNTPPGRG